MTGPLNLFTNFNYTGPVNQGTDEAANFREHQRLKSFIYTNGGARIDVGEHFRFFIDVDNIFDVNFPPDCASLHITKTGKLLLTK